MNKQQSRAFVILNIELSTFEHGRQLECKFTNMLNRAIKTLKGHETNKNYFHVSEQTSFMREIQKILHLTTISITDMVIVLEELRILWKEEGDYYH